MGVGCSSTRRSTREKLALPYTNRAAEWYGRHVAPLAASLLSRLESRQQPLLKDFGLPLGEHAGHRLDDALAREAVAHGDVVG